MVDVERLGRTLARIREDVSTIRAVAGSRDLTTDEVALAAVKYSFVTAIEGCVRAAAHIVSSEALGMPESSAGAVRSLGEHGVIPEAVAASVSRAVGFRNVLVHEYAEVDDDAVRANVALLLDLDSFTAGVAEWVTHTG